MPTLLVGTNGILDDVKRKEMTTRRFVSPAEIHEHPTRWLWGDRIPLGAITTLDGDPCSGKSTMTCDIAARVTTGRALPDRNEAISPAGVVLLQAEDCLGTTVLPNRRAAVSERTLKRAKRDLGVRSWKFGSGSGSRWFWELPDDEKLLRPLKDQDLDYLMNELIYGNADRLQEGSDQKRQTNRRDQKQQDDNGDEDCPTT